MCFLVCMSVSANATNTPLNIKPVKAGWKAAQDGYFMDTATGVALATEWSNTEQQLYTWRDGYMDLQRLMEQQEKERKASLAALSQQIEQDSIKAQRKQRESLVLGLLIGAVLVTIAH